MLILYSLMLLMALVLGSPWWLSRMITSGKYREGLSERLGVVPRRFREGLRGDPLIWIHAVSVGEVLAASRLIAELTEQLSGKPRDAAWRVVLSTTTRTGQKLARERFGAERVFYFPLDFAWAVRAWLRALQPRMLVLVETEFWPRVLAECRRAGIPVAVVNARISDRSWPRYRRLAWIWKRLLGGLAATLAQSELDADRLRALGAANVRVAGNLKYDVRAVQDAPVTTLLRKHLPRDTPVLVCGSTMAGEEEMLLDALPPGMITILAPRHPERFAAVGEMLHRHAAQWARRSEWISAPADLEPGTIFLLDSIGELASVYSLARAAFVGGSLVPGGGHNPLEPAQFGLPIVMGPGYENFRSIVDKLREHEGICIVRSEGLKDALADVLAETSGARAMGERARRIFESEAGATERAIQTLLAIVEARQ
jgi:3-deoxy-D-manno-octulosonic-acid transferase